MFDYNHFMTLADGEEKMQYLKTCITEADNAADFEEALDMRYLYIRESVFNGDSYKGIIMFPEYMALFDKHPDKHETHSFMIAFKWIIENVISFYQISSEMIENYFEEFKKRCEMYGYSLRTYYMKKMLFYIDIDPEKAHALHELFRKSERDDLSDCNACEVSHDIRLELLYGSAEKAVAMLNDMLEQGISCAEVPEVTYGYCVDYFTKAGMLSEADHYADLLLPMINDNENFLMELSHIMSLKTITHPDMAFQLFTRLVKLFAVCRNPKMRFYFASAAARFLNTVPAADDAVFNLLLPRSFELYNEKDEYTFAMFKKYFSETAADIAEKMDKRNGTSAYTDRLNFVYPDKPVNELKLPAHSTVFPTQYLLAVPYKNESGFPSADTIKGVISSFEEYLITDFYVDQETKKLFADIYDKKTKAQIALSFLKAPLSDDFAEFNDSHAVSDDEHIYFNDNFHNMIVMSVNLNTNADRAALLALKTAHGINTDGSPVFADIMNMKMLSAKWVKLNAENDILPLDDMYWNIHFCGSGNGVDFTAYTSGLNAFGSRNLIANHVTRENANYVCRLLDQAANKITGVSLMCDENIEMPFGVWYNNESIVSLGWIKPSEAYPEYSEQEDFDNIFAVPFISVRINGEKKKILFSDITDDIAEKLTVKPSGNYSTKQYEAARLTFDTALNAMTDGDTLLTGFTTVLSDGDTADIFGNVIKDSSPLRCTIESKVDDIPELAELSETAVNKNEIFFWRLTRGEEEYNSDTAYLLM